MLILVSISAFIVIIAILIFTITQQDKNKYENIRITSFVCMFVFGFFGLILLPTTVKTHSQIKEIQNYTIIKSENAIVLDLTNAGLNTTFSYVDELKKFNTYDAVTKFSTSTKFFIVKEKSFYNVTTNKYIAWSNPPYTNLNIE